MRARGVLAKQFCEAITDLFDNAHLVLRSFHDIIYLENLGNVNKSTFEISNKAQLSLLFIFGCSERLVFDVELFLGSFNMTTLNKLNTVFPSS
jgi:hypothetical protein